MRIRFTSDDKPNWVDDRDHHECQVCMHRCSRITDITRSILDDRCACMTAIRSRHVMVPSQRPFHNNPYHTSPETSPYPARDLHPQPFHFTHLPITLYYPFSTHLLSHNNSLVFTHSPLPIATLRYQVGRCGLL